MVQFTFNILCASNLKTLILDLNPEMFRLADDHNFVYGTISQRQTGCYKNYNCLIPMVNILRGNSQIYSQPIIWNLYS